MIEGKAVPPLYLRSEPPRLKPPSWPDPTRPDLRSAAGPHREKHYCISARPNGRIDADLDLHGLGHLATCRSNLTLTSRGGGSRLRSRLPQANDGSPKCWRTEAAQGLAQRGTGLYTVACRRLPSLAVACRRLPSLAGPSALLSGDFIGMNEKPIGAIAP
jgi:hypothetical protein